MQLFIGKFQMYLETFQKFAMELYCQNKYLHKEAPS